MAAQLSARTYGMTVHRFADPEYAALTVQMRGGEHLALLFDRLHALGLVVLHESTETVQETIARDARDGDATAAMNDEACELNARIRDERVRAGLLDDARTTTGSDGLSIGAGDVIRRGRTTPMCRWRTVRPGLSRASGWTGRCGRGRTAPDGSGSALSGCRPLAYASTAYGVQGATVPGSHTVLSDALDASGVYVGMTRGQETNRLHIVAADVDDAREQFTAALERDRADRSLVAATQAHRVQSRLVERQMREGALTQRALAGSTPSRVIAHAAKLRKQAERDRRGLAQIEALPVTEAAQLVRELTAELRPRVKPPSATAPHERRAPAQLEQYRPSAGHDRTGSERGGLGM